MTDGLASWADARDGHYIDRDSFPAWHPCQCHDVWLDYLVLLGGSIGDGHAPGEGYTVAVWEAFPEHRPALAERFTKHWGTSGIRAGDVVFWPVGASNHRDSHVVVALSEGDQFGTILCLSQNPGPARIMRLSTHQVAGYLRPITNPSGDEDMTMTPQQAKQLSEVHAALYSMTKSDGTLAKLPARTAAATLDSAVKREGTDKDGKPRTGTLTLRAMLATWEHQIGLTRRLVERIKTKLNA